MIHLKLHNREAEELLRDLDRRKDELLDGLLMQLAEKLRKALPPKRDSEPYAVSLNDVRVKYTRDRPRKTPARQHSGGHRHWCGQCGQKYSAPACGPTHAAVAAQRDAQKRSRGAKKPYDANDERALVAKFGKKWSRKPSKAEKRESRASVREQCLKRANGICECGCGGALTDPTKGDIAGLANVGRPVFDHMWGRGKGRRPEALETCWILRWDCNEARTHNQPDAVTWWKRYLFHCEVHGYAAEAKAARDMIYKLETKATLPAAPKIHRRS